MMRNLTGAVMMTVFALGAGACTMKVKVKTPETSPIRYEALSQDKTGLDVADNRGAGDRPLHVGKASVKFTNVPDEIAFLEEHLVSELAARGLPVSTQSSDRNIRLNVKTFRMRNEQKVFAPYLTYSTFAGDLIVGDASYRVSAYFKIGKVPVWTMKEVHEPCYNVPLGELVKEIASKVNRLAYGLRASDAQVLEIAQQLEGELEKMSFLKVRELGYSNNPTAVPHLLRLANSDVHAVRAAALSSLGMLGAVEQLPLLIERYQSTNNNERFMALKAIGDLNHPDSIHFLDSVKSSPAYDEQRIKEIVDLYI